MREKEAKFTWKMMQVGAVPWRLIQSFLSHTSNKPVMFPTGFRCGIIPFRLEPAKSQWDREHQVILERTVALGETSALLHVSR